MAEDRIRIFCVDDHEATTTLYALALSFEPDMEFVGSRTSTAGLVQALAAARASVLMLDLLIPGCDSLEALSDVRAHFPSLIVIVASGLDEGEVVEAAFRRGASGFYLKTMDFTDLTSMIRRAASGERINTGPNPSHSLGGPKLGGARPRT